MGMKQTLSYSWSGTGANALPVDGSGAPTGAESYGTSSAYATIQSLSRSYTNDAKQVVRLDNYYNLSGVSYSTSDYIGSNTANYYTTTYGYNMQGRLAEVINPNMTITVTTYDVLGRQVGTYVGTDDVPSSNLNGDPLGVH